jgi:hypothetical protein
MLVLSRQLTTGNYLPDGDGRGAHWGARPVIVHGYVQLHTIP